MWVAVINWPKACTRWLLNDRGLPSSKDVNSPSRRDLSRILRGQWRTAWEKVSGLEAQRGQVWLGNSLYQEGCAAR